MSSIYDEPIEWLSCKTELLRLFTEDEIKKALVDTGTTVRDLTYEEEFETVPPYQKPSVMVKDWHTGTVRRTMNYKGKEWETHEEARIQTWRVTAQYQSLSHGKIIHRLLSNRFKWFTEFTWNIYGFDYQKLENYEIYMKTTKAEGDTDNVGASLYVPLKALVDGDVEAIKKRHGDYMKWYYSDLGITGKEKREREKKYLAKALQPLQSPEAQKLFEYLKTN